MEQFSHQKEFSTEIIETSNLYGTISGNVVVKNKATFSIYGMVQGDLFIQKDSFAIIYGTITGAIFNRGKCDIMGTVLGLLIEEGGIFNVDKNAQVS